MVKILKDCPNEIKETAKKLAVTSMLLISVGFNVPHNIKNLWFYICDEDLLPARVYCPNIKSKNNTPVGCSSLQFEIYYSKSRPLNMNMSNILEHVSNIIEKLNIAKKNNIIFMDCKNVNYANIIFHHDVYINKKKIFA